MQTVPHLFLQSDARRLPIRPDSVNLFICSPPYASVRDYQGVGEEQIGAESSLDGYLDSLLAATEEMVRCLSPAGSIFFNLGDVSAGSGGAGGDYNEGGLREGQPGYTGTVKRYAPVAPDPRQGHSRLEGGVTGRRGHGSSFQGFRPKTRLLAPHRFAIRCEDELGLICRADICWRKKSPMPESATDRVWFCHEYIFHLTKEPQYFADLSLLSEEGRRHSVWDVSTEPYKFPDAVLEKCGLETKHHAMYPGSLVASIIKAWSRAGDVVCDPFSGSGTTVGVARALGRIGIGCDLSLPYTKLARWRVDESDHFQRVASRAWVDNQEKLF